MDNEGNVKGSDKAGERAGLDEPDPDWEPFHTRVRIRGVRPRPDPREIAKPDHAVAGVSGGQVTETGHESADDTGAAQEHTGRGGGE